MVREGNLVFEGTQELAENKLLILYIFDKLQNPASNNQITEIVLQNNLLNYFHLQQYLSELVDSNFLKLDKQEKKHLYSLSVKGKNVLEYFENRISSNKKDIIDVYMDIHGELIKKETEVTADYFPDNDNNYSVTCKIIEDKKTIIELKLNVESNQKAKSICANWKSNASEIQKKLTALLIE